MKYLVVLFLIFLASYLSCTTLSVNILQLTNPNTNVYHTITEAYNAAVSGDVIEIYPGDYYEYLTITKSLTFIGTTQNSARIITLNQTGFTISSSNVIVKNLTFKCAGANGIYISGALPIVRNCLFDSCADGIYLRTNTTAEISNCIFRGTSNGLHMWGTIYGTLKNCLFHNNATAIYNDDGASYMNFYNSVFIGNSNNFIRDATFASWHGVIEYNAATNTTFTGTEPTNLIGIDPLLTNTAGTPYYNYFLTPNSPCIDAGIPDILYNDLDGTRSDMGIFGGNYPWGAGKPVVLDVNLTPNTVQQGGTFSIEATGQTK